MTDYPMRSPYLPSSTEIEAYVYDGHELICEDCYWDKKTTETQRRKCEPIFAISEFEEKEGEGVSCSWCHEYIKDPNEEDDYNEEKWGFMAHEEIEDRSLDSDPFEGDVDEHPY